MLSGLVLSTLRLLIVLAGATAGVAFVQATPALADLRVCNQTGNQVSIALGYSAQRGWQSEGWWVAPPGQCAIVYRGDLNLVSRYFYLFAADDVGGGAWDGAVFMCTRDESFTVIGVEDCLARGYERTGFFEVDTQDRSDWMLQLIVGNGSAPSDVGADQIIPLDDVPAGADGKVIR